MNRSNKFICAFPNHPEYASIEVAMRGIEAARYRVTEKLIVSEDFTTDRFIQLKLGVDRVLKYLKALAKFGFSKASCKEDKSFVLVDCEMKSLLLHARVSSRGVVLEAQGTTEIALLLKRFLAMHVDDPENHFRHFAFVFGLNDRTVHERHAALVEALDEEFEL
jgi:hypothetical protein